MEVDSVRIHQLIEQPQESLSIELKAWIDPDQNEGKAKIVIAALALRNYGGGYLVIGFDDKTLQPLVDGVPSNVRGLFHVDKIQGMIAKYSSEPFEIAVEFPQRDGQDFPVIVIPTGVRTPVVSKSSLENQKSREKPLIREDTVYVRSLSANNTPSSTQAKAKDWSRLMEVCFDNREADIGRFFRRQLGGVNSELLKTLFAEMTEGFDSEASNADLLERYLQESEQRYQQVLKERNIVSPKRGTWETALIIQGEVPHHAPNQEFLTLLSSSNPKYSGWSVWLDSRRFGESAHPRVMNGVWEALITEGVGYQDFMRLDPKGRFFLRRFLTDDVERTRNSPPPLTALDFRIVLLRVAEALAVGVAFANAMGCSTETTQLSFAFKWTKLNGRKLSSWSNLLLWVPAYQAYQDEVSSHVNVPLSTPVSALSPYVSQAIKPLYEVFEGFTLGEDVVEDLTRRLIERRL
jgi:hypothetical protein